MEKMNYLPLFTAMPLAAAFVVFLVGRRARRLGDFLAPAVAAVLLLLSLAAFAGLADGGKAVYALGGWKPPLGICLVLDRFSALLLTTVNLATFLAALYSVRYMERYTDKIKYHTLFCLMLAGMNGVVITGDIFNLFVFLEIASIASYALVAFGTEAEELEAAFKYMVMGALASSLILLALALTYGRASTLNLADPALVLGPPPFSALPLFILALFTFGFGIKAAVFPFHSWLPDAHPAAPAPISALLSGVLIKSLGVYAFARIFFNVFGAPPPFPDLAVIAGLVSMTAGALLAVGQEDMKRMLAYSSVSQVGYIVFALGIGTPLALAAALFHLVNHAVAKSLLFLAAGAVESATGTRDLRRLGGLFSKMPLVGTTSLLASLSISGVPPLAGFFSKFLIILAAVRAGRPFGALLAAAVSVITLAYYLKFLRFVFFGKTRETGEAAGDPPPAMAVPIAVLGLLCLAGGLFALPPVYDYLFGAAARVLLAGQGYGPAVFGLFR